MVTKVRGIAGLQVLNDGVRVRFRSTADAKPQVVRRGRLWITYARLRRQPSLAENTTALEDFAKAAEFEAASNSRSEELEAACEGEIRDLREDRRH